MIRYFYLIVISLCVGLVSCQSENAEIDTPADGAAMAFSTRGGGAAGVILFSGGEQMGLFVTRAGETLKSAGNSYDNALLANQDGKWNSGIPMYYPNNQAVDIYAYMPYQNQVGDVNVLTLPVAVNQAADGAYKSSDFLWAKVAAQTKSKEGITLDFAHAMSRAEVKVIAGNGINAGDMSAALLSVKLLNQKTAAVIDLATGVAAVADEAVAGEVSPAVCGDTVAAAIVVPQTFAAGTDFITLMLDGQLRTYKLDNDITFTAGKVKRFNITVSNESLMVSVVDVKEWVSDGTVNGNAVLQIAAPEVSEGNAASGTSPLVSAEFGVYLFSGTDKLGENLLYKTSAGGQVSTGTAPVYYPTTGTVNLYAYAPYTTPVADLMAHTFAVKGDQSGAAAMKASDLLTAKAEGLTNGGAPVALTFAHRMSRVVVNLVQGNGVTTADMAAAGVWICNTALSAKINLKDGTAAQLSRDAEVIPSRNGNSYEAILVPQAVSGEMFVKISINGVVWGYKPDVLVLKPGSRHTLNITVANSGITVAAPVVSGWNDEPELDGEGVKIPRGVMMNWSGNECPSQVWSKVVALGGDMLLVAEKNGKTYVNVCPKGHDGVILEFDGNGMPGRVITNDNGGSHDLAIFFPIEIGSVSKLGMGLVTTDRQIAILEPEVMPEVFKTGKLSAKIQGIVKRLASIVMTNGMENQLPPAAFGFGSALINTLDEVDLENLPSFADNGVNVLNQCGMNTACELVDATDAAGALVVVPGGGDNMLEAKEKDYQTEVDLIKDGSKYGFGDIKITLKWDCSGDVDLHLMDPDSHYIKHSSKTPVGCEGSLDKDNTGGYGPENIFYPKNTASQGVYKVKVNNYGKMSSGGFTLFIYAKGKTKTYNGVLSSSVPDTFFTFDLSGNFNNNAASW